MPTLLPAAEYRAIFLALAEEFGGIMQARTFTWEGHESIGQKRNYSDEPYGVHTDEVAGIIAAFCGDHTMVKAGSMHDLVEDVNRSPYDLAGITRVGGPAVAGMVDDLTNRFTLAAYPKLVRRERKKLEVARIAGIPAPSKTLKLADIISNARNLPTASPEFWIVYRREALDLLPVLAAPMHPGNAELHEIATMLLAR